MQTIFVHSLFYWQIGTKNLTKREFIVEPSFLTSWTIRKEKCARGHVQQNKTTNLSIYLSIWKPFWKRVCIYIYIYIIADPDRARPSVCSAQEKCVSLAERCTTDSKISFSSVRIQGIFLICSPSRRNKVSLTMLSYFTSISNYRVGTLDS